MLNVMVLEDQLAVQDVVIELIDELGVPTHVECAGSLKQARSLLKTREWDCLVADLNLGDGESLDLIAEFRSSSIAMPVILISGFLTSEKMQRAAELGITEILHKPFLPNALLTCLEKVLRNLDISPRSLIRADTPKILRGHLLQDLFEMDRSLGLLYRLMHEVPRQSEVGAICSNALSLGMEMIHASMGMMALYDRGNRTLVLTAHHGMREKQTAAEFALKSDLAKTPFESLLEGTEDFIQALADGRQEYECWPGVSVRDYVAIPLRLQERTIGLLCLMDADVGSLTDQLRHLLGLLVTQLDTLMENRAVSASLADSLNETIIALVHTLEARDRYTKNHSTSVSRLAVAFARDMGLGDDSISLIRVGALMHDIGKVGIPDAILLKPGGYTDHEFSVMKAHPAIGDSILKHMDSLSRERDLVRHHHERWDGRGYPDGIKGENITQEARVLCVADAIDAMTSNRVYRKARPLSFCLEQLKNNSGTQFDARVVEVAIAAIENGLVKTEAVPEVEVTAEGKEMSLASLLTKRS
ncbi:MAG: HD domain-containing phosphohydrolase [Mariprofundaceae bacterium]